ncbi:hypothetical protein Aeq9CBH6_17960 [Adlercreutzia equolifaciens]|nr:hypothetical protein Aeq9CBH6_17960 [Adlercreutzia equolifaciens]
MATAPSIAWRRLIARRASRPSDEVVDRGASLLAFSFTPVSFLQSLQAPESRNRAPGTAHPSLSLAQAILSTAFRENL